MNVQREDPRGVQGGLKSPSRNLIVQLSFDFAAAYEYANRTMMVMSTAYDTPLILLSVFVAILASFVALDLVGSVAKATGRAKITWLFCGALAMGLGIWSMHFIGMLAFEMPGLPMSYDISLMTLSILIAFGASALALYLMSRASTEKWSIFGGAAAMAAAITGMHYVGMFSMRMPARIEWNLWLVALSIAIAFASSYGGILLAIQLRRSSKPLRLQVLSSFLFGIGIAGMHYTGMEAAVFVHEDMLVQNASNVLPSSELVTVVTASTLVVLAVALASSIIDRALARRTRNAEENARLYREAEAANITKTRFLANMSHEIRTPLSAILGFAELLLDDSIDLSQRREYLSIILRSARSLTQLIDDILDLSKIEMGRLEIENAPLTVRPFVKDILALLKIKADEKALSLHFEDDPAVPEMLLADTVRLRQILVNVVGNAVKFTHNGSVTIRLKYIATVTGDLFGFEIEDTGIGMTIEQQGKIFRAFSQADNSMSRKFGGTGLGLDISRRLARAMGGDLILTKTAPGQGSTFLVTIQLRLPIQSSAPVKVETASPAPRAGAELRGLQILLVEDVPENQVLVSRLLQKRGANVEFADNGRIGVERALAKAFDVILMDIQMPVMNGYEATRELRALGLKTPIIALTAHAMREDRDACLQHGCTDYLTKPINVGELIPTIRRYTERVDHIG